MYRMHVRNVQSCVGHLRPKIRFEDSPNLQNIHNVCHQRQFAHRGFRQSSADLPGYRGDTKLARCTRSADTKVASGQSKFESGPGRILGRGGYERRAGLVACMAGVDGISGRATDNDGNDGGSSRPLFHIAHVPPPIN